MRAYIEPPSEDTLRILFGPNDLHRRQLREKLGVKIVLREGKILLEGETDAVERATGTVERLLEALRDRDGKGYEAEEFQWLLAGAGEPEAEGGPAAVIIPGGVKIEPKSPNQREYIAFMRRFDLVFGIGPAGTGKTYLAVACAVEALKLGRVRRIVLARPAVEAGERLGFLPGDMQEKINPYLRPLYDSLGDMLPRGEIAQYVETGVIEVAPLAFMRGRTLNRAFVILDEAQNTTAGQMKMFLTRLGAHSRAVVTGDITQTDLLGTERSGLVHARDILRDVPGVAFLHLTRQDVVRHRLVRDILSAYEHDGEPE